MPNDTAPTSVTIPVVAPESPSTMKPLYKALVAAQRAAMAVGKDAENTYHKYKYASAEAVIAEARQALNGAGLALTLLSWGRHLPVAGDHPHTRIEVHYRLLHEEGVALDLSASSYVIPEKGRPADKAEAGALTTNLSYVLRTLLLLPREDEGTSPDTRDDRNYEPGRLSPRGAPGKPGFDLTSRLDRLAKASTPDEVKAIDAELTAAWDSLSTAEQDLYTKERTAAVEAMSRPADVRPIVAKIEAAKSLDELRTMKPEIDAVWRATDAAGTQRIKDAAEAAKARVEQAAPAQAAAQPEPKPEPKPIVPPPPAPPKAAARKSVPF